VRAGAPPRDLDTSNAFFHCALRSNAAYLTRAIGKDRFAVELLGADARPKWSTELDGTVFRPFWLSGDQVIVAPGSPAQHVVALDAATGKIRWTVAGPRE
jgi:outer membrane protein assembly factor BamB